MTGKLAWFSWNFWTQQSLRHICTLAHSRTFTRELVTVADQRGRHLNKIRCEFLNALDWNDSLQAGDAFSMYATISRKDMDTTQGGSRQNQTGKSAWVSKPLNSHLSETTSQESSVWEAGSHAGWHARLHSTAPTSPLTCDKEVVSFHHSTHSCGAAWSFLSPCRQRGCFHVIWKHVGLLQIDTTGRIRVLWPALGQTAQPKQREPKWEGNHTESFLTLLCIEKGQLRTEHGGSWASRQPLVPPHHISSEAAVPQSSEWRYLSQCYTQRTSFGWTLLHLTPVSHVECGHPSKLEPWS